MLIIGQDGKLLESRFGLSASQCNIILQTLPPEEILKCLEIILEAKKAGKIRNDKQRESTVFIMPGSEAANKIDGAYTWGVFSRRNKAALYAISKAA